MAEIILSSNEFRALASDTRVDIIKLLRSRNHTLTELSKKLNLAAPTVKQHLELLQTAELVQAIDEGRKWKYYSLTRKGKTLLASEPPTNVLIVLAVSVLALAVLTYSFVSMSGIAQLGIYGTGEQIPSEGKDVIATPAESGGAIIGESQENVCKSTEPIMQYGVLSANNMLLLLAGIIFVSLLAGFMLGKLKR